MMAFTWTYAALLCTLLHGAFSDDNCSTFQTVWRENGNCHQDHQSFRHWSIINSSSSLLTSLRKDCSNVKPYYDCIDNYISDCSSKEAIKSEARNSMNFCNGSDATNWVKELAFAFENFNAFCLAEVRFQEDCVEMSNRYFQLTRNDSASFAAGLQELKEIKSGFMLCVRKALEQKGSCQGKPWQEVFIVVAMSVFGLVSNRPVGVYLDQGDIQLLQEFAAEVRSVDMLDALWP